MKKTRFLRTLSLILALLCIVGTLASCGNVFPATIAKNGESDYVIVYNSKDSQSGNAANYLATELERLTGVKFTVQDDRTAYDKKVPEIRVGRTNRGIEYELQRTVRSGEYVIAREKKNVYILAEGEGIATQACKSFISSVLSDDFKVSGSGEILRNHVAYMVSEVSLNGAPITDYTVLTAEGSTDLDWGKVTSYVEQQISAVSGYLFTSATYTSIDDLPYHPAIVLNGSTEGLAADEYRVEITKKDDVILSAGSAEAAQALGIKLMEGLTNVNEDKTVSMSLAAASGKMIDAPMISLSDGSDLRVMTFNVFGGSQHAQLMTYVSSSVYAYAPDFVCMQEFANAAYDIVSPDLKEAGYDVVGTKFTCASPAYEDPSTAPANMTNIGKSCSTPIFYRADRWEVVEYQAYLYHMDHRFTGSNTKSMTWAVFKNKTDNSLVLVISTHYPLVTGDYAKYPGYETATNAKEGKAWRLGATEEILAAYDSLREKYPGIVTVIGGDLNAREGEQCLTNLENHATLSSGYLMAPEGQKTTGGSHHSYGKAPDATATPIDHIYVSDDVATVQKHQIIQDTITVQGSDHAPVILDIARK